jgi:hypothetical protein
MLVILCLLFASAIFVCGITWGLPSRAADKFLFGDRTPWSGAEILALAPIEEHPNRGADVDADPLVGRDRVIVLNETDKQRAEIVRRYRLFTYQPDEYNTMKSLSGMNPGRLQLDPRMYQYGGLWIYPVGALLKLASVVGIIHLTPDKAYYLDHPEQFARFYVIARLYSAVWGLVGAWAVYMLARKLTGGAVPAAIISMSWACMPVVVNMAHEAKPHLAGLSLMLLAILAASRYVETGSRRWWVAAGALCGAALAMVISSLIIFIILPLMTLLRPMPWRQRVRVLVLASFVGGVVYLMTNPYVAINLVTNPAVLRSNLGASTSMYEATAGSGIVNAYKLIVAGTMPFFPFIGGLFFLQLLIGWHLDGTRITGLPRYVLWLLAAPAAIVLVQFVALAAGKPAEYGRFALLPNTVLYLGAEAMGWFSYRRQVVRYATIGIIPIAFLMGAFLYLAHFRADAKFPSTRIAEAVRLKKMANGGARRLAIVAEPAPYCLPPVDLWRWEINLLPRHTPPVEAARDIDADVLIRPLDEYNENTTPKVAGFVRIIRLVLSFWVYLPTEISWAAKPFEILVAERRSALVADDLVGGAATSPSQTPAPP